MRQRRMAKQKPVLTSSRVGSAASRSVAASHILPSSSAGRTSFRVISDPDLVAASRRCVKLSTSPIVLGTLIALKQPNESELLFYTTSGLGLEAGGGVQTLLKQKFLHRPSTLARACLKQRQSCICVSPLTHACWRTGFARDQTADPRL